MPMFTATATSLGSEIKLKADITYVDELAADSIDAAFADLKITDAETIVTEYLTVTDKATINAMALGDKNVKLKTTDYVKSVGRTKRYVKSPADVTIEIWEISSISNDELKYLGYD